MKGFIMELITRIGVNMWGEALLSIWGTVASYGYSIAKDVKSKVCVLHLLAPIFAFIC